jgi:hypothetical protein
MINLNLRSSYSEILNISGAFCTTYLPIPTQHLVKDLGISYVDIRTKCNVSFRTRKFDLSIFKLYSRRNILVGNRYQPIIK